MHLVLLQTSGDQAYLFATNCLRENVGASELTYRVGTQFVLEAVENQGGPHLWSNEDSPQKMREKLSQVPENAPVEIIIATYRKALLLVKEKKVAQSIVSEVTERALREAPGLDICGIISEPFDWQNDNIHLKIKELEQQLEQVRNDRPLPSARFPRLPITALCASSGLPAYRLGLSKVSHTKRKAADNWESRIGKILKGTKLSDLEKNFEQQPWFAVIHAGANGLDQIFLDFDQQPRNRTYVDKLRQFSLALEDATENAFRKALRALKKISILPLVLSGDDLTVLCDGFSALEFTRVFLKEFETTSPRLSACAGVTITKSHFPTHNAYKIAVQLLKEAKTVEKRAPCSAMDFQVIYDSTHLSEIRQRLFVDNKQTRLTAKPYVVTPKDKIEGSEWAKNHHINDLLQRIRTLLEKDAKGRPKLPISQVQSLREGLGRDEADGRLRLILEHYALNQFLESGKNTLFRQTENYWETRFLDAFEAAAFWEQCRR